MEKLLALLKKYWPALVLIFFAMLSKLVGFLRNAFIAYFFGTSSSSDLLGILMFPTDFVTSYLINQTIITALTIFFSRESSQKNEIFLRTFHFYRVILILTSLGLVGIMLFLYPEVPWQYSVLAAIPGIFYGMAGIMQSYLNYNRVFLWPGAQEMLGNLILLGGVIVAAKFGIYLYVVVMILTGIIRILVQLPDVKRFLKGKNWFYELFGIQQVGFEKNLLKYIGPILFTFILSGIPGFLILDKLHATGAGYIAAYNYSNKVIGLFNPIFVIPITTYLIPTMQRWMEEQRSVKFISRATFALISVGSLAFAAFIALMPDVLIKLIYARGSFSQDSVWLTAQFLRYQSFAVVGYALMYYLLQMTLLHNRARRLIASYITGTVVILAFLYLLTFPPYITVGVALTAGVVVSLLILVL